MCENAYLYFTLQRTGEQWYIIWVMKASPSWYNSGALLLSAALAHYNLTSSELFPPLHSLFMYHIIVCYFIVFCTVFLNSQLLFYLKNSPPFLNSLKIKCLIALTFLSVAYRVKYSRNGLDLSHLFFSWIPKAVGAWNSNLVCFFPCWGCQTYSAFKKAIFFFKKAHIISPFLCSQLYPCHKHNSAFVKDVLCLQFQQAECFKNYFTICLDLLCPPSFFNLYTVLDAFW